MDLIIRFLRCLSSNEKGLKRGSNPDLCDAGAVFYQLSYQANWEMQIHSFKIHISNRQKIPVLSSKGERLSMHGQVVYLTLCSMKQPKVLLIPSRHNGQYTTASPCISRQIQNQPFCGWRETSQVRDNPQNLVVQFNNTKTDSLQCQFVNSKLSVVAPMDC